MVRVKSLGALLAAAALLLSGCGSSQNNGDGVDQVGVGVDGKALTQIAPADRTPAAVATGPDLDGTGTVTTRHLGKVTVINVWASWCAPCRKEAPDLNEASTESKDVAVFIGLNVRESSEAAARAFVRSSGVPYAHIYDPNGTQLLAFAGELSPNAIPSTLIIDREGRTAVRVVGTVTKTTLIQMIREVSEGR